MKNSLFLIALGLFISVKVLGQTKVALINFVDSTVTKDSELHSNFDITLGYIPKSMLNALKASISVNNIFFKRVGGYVSLEKGLNSNYFSNTYGITTSINNYFYLWGGFGWYAKSELFKHIEWEKVRKELGIGFLPYKMIVIRLGWSVEVGPTFAAGIKIPM
jgi:hypothetical protein